ncbi:MAG: hypothetical protein NZ849_08480 [Meiothermus sp.]|nr:hypothetical protein [Meiothermus sp.]MCS7057504.1 hypothetical protein [Meiothermus sp.]MCS7194928.1 hypothetical protein [Meiothermus sp.]MCX7739950.1 hypothetical protein [Meiothermus sp.]MDW8090857.1 hypothetical protein [Meiothermus sp.]MDW8482447.1 hypothetical protein [Meiothermus sp.]
MMQVNVPDDTDLDDLSLEIDEKGLRFISNGRTVAGTDDIEDYYIDEIEQEGEEDWEGEEEEA